MSSKNALILLGKPGAGKTTIAHYFRDNHGYKYISTGELLRELAKRPEAGHEAARAAAAVTQGLILQDRFVIDLVDSAIHKHPKASIVLDGFPRTVSAANALIQILRSETFDNRYVSVISLQVCTDLALMRVKQRGRADDHDNTVLSRRISTHEEDFQEILNHLSQAYRVSSYDASIRVSEIVAEIEASLQGGKVLCDSNARFKVTLS